ncbi:DUF3151 domain-containing protein [Nonomuraea turkmeniaca]|uniref:DUF3151 domain-containing protein n=2 Tax=Nonomuraea turkmeniaca TaxID=103838 RepID=A0A5S4FVR2_9ACTN|nr:DUF3151 domain-containing protein [Nonomuraea turkmeniaca]
MTCPMDNLLAGPPPTHLPDQPEAREALEAGAKAADVAARFPAFPAAWAALAEEYFAQGHAVTSYAFARTGYHRGLDQLRRSGWKGHGPIPWEHAPNRGFLRCLYALSRAAQAIGEKDEAERCLQFLKDSTESGYDALSKG